ncbi:MAG: hypothetical protein AB4058_04685, partial [Microcystaceae cyanobacterium]
MSKKQGISSSKRYQLAGIKRFANFMFWGPPLILGSVVFIVWQYQQNPQWLSGSPGNSQTLPQSDQLEEPGIYNDLPVGNSAPTPNFFNNSNNVPVVPSANQSLTPSTNTNTGINSGSNPFNPLNNSANPSNPTTKSPSLFKPLFPTKNNANGGTTRPPSSSTRSPSRIEINVNS